MACKRETINFACVKQTNKKKNHNNNNNKKTFWYFLFFCWTSGNYYSTKAPFECPVRIPFILNPFRCPLLSTKIFLSRVINLLLTSLARDRTERISASVFSARTSLRSVRTVKVCQDLGPIISQYGPRAWLIRCIYRYNNIFHNSIIKSMYEPSDISGRNLSYPAFCSMKRLGVFMLSLDFSDSHSVSENYIHSCNFFWISECNQLDLSRSCTKH